MKNKKGFTLIEVLAVIVILAVITGLIIPNIKRYKEKGNKEYYEKLKETIVLAAKDYYSTHPEELPRGQMGEEKGVDGKTQVVTIYNSILDANKLVNGNYLINEVVDENGEKCITDNSSVIVRNKKDGTYSYGLCNICSDKIENDRECNVSNLNEMLYCEIEDVKDAEIDGFKEIIVSHNGDEISYPDKVIKEENEGKERYFVNQSGNYIFNVIRGEQISTCSVTIIKKVEDNEKPTCVLLKNKTVETNSNYTVNFHIQDNNSINEIFEIDENGNKMVQKSYSCGSATDVEYSVTISKTNKPTDYRLKVKDCNENIGECDVVTVPAKTNNNPTYPDNEICIDGDTRFLSGFSNCEATCVNGEWKCLSQDSCSYGCDSNKNYYKQCNGIKTIIEYSSSKCGSSLSCRPNMETTAGGKCYKCKADGSGYDEITCINETNPGTGCFIKGTKILTKDGYKNIEDIKVGDIVKSLNIKTGKIEYKSVYIKYVYDDLTQNLYTINVNGEEINVTETHNFYIKDSKNNIVARAAKYLKVGDLVIGENKLTYPITKISYEERNDIVYNFAVRDNHNYFVGEKGYLVHNEDENGKELTDFCSKNDEKISESESSLCEINGVIGDYINEYDEKNDCVYFVCKARCKLNDKCTTSEVISGVYNSNCKCIKECTVGDSCVTSEGRGKYILGCKCQVKPNPNPNPNPNPKPCIKSCSSGYKLNTTTCTCKCNRNCKNNEVLNTSTCTCKKTCGTSCGRNYVCQDGVCKCNLNCSKGTIPNPSCNGCISEY